MMRADSPVDLMQTFNSSSSSITKMNVPRSDVESDHDALRQQHDMAAQLLDMVGRGLDGADETIGNLEKDPELLSHAILRRCTEFADLISGLARKLEQQSPQEQQRLALAIHEDIRSLRLQVESHQSGCYVNSHDNNNNNSNNRASPDKFKKLSMGKLSPTSLSTPRMSEIPTDFQDEEPDGHQEELIFRDNIQDSNENHIFQAVAGASTLLRDVESAFRDIDKNDAEEIADVALILARLFLISLQSIHDTLTPESLIQSTSSAGTAERSTVVIEELADSVAMNDDENEDQNEEQSTEVERTTTSKMSQSSTPSKPRSMRQKSLQRVRVLWPPIRPRVDEAIGWTQAEAAKRPLLAAALGFALWPAAVSTAIAGGTVCVADHFLQDAYRHFQDGPLISNLERGAASMYQAGKLTFITGKLAGKQTIRIVQKQIDRNGGVGPILENVGQMALDRVTHPVETAVMICSGVGWGIARIKDTVNQIVSMHQEGAAAQALQP